MVWLDIAYIHTLPGSVPPESADRSANPSRWIRAKHKQTPYSTTALTTTPPPHRRRPRPRLPTLPPPTEPPDVSPAALVVRQSLGIRHLRTHLAQCWRETRRRRPGEYPRSRPPPPAPVLHTPVLVHRRPPQPSPTLRTRARAKRPACSLPTVANATAPALARSRPPPPAPILHCPLPSFVDGLAYFLCTQPRASRAYNRPSASSTVSPPRRLPSRSRSQRRAPTGPERLIFFLPPAPPRSPVSIKPCTTQNWPGTRRPRHRRLRLNPTLSTAPSHTSVLYIWNLCSVVL